MLHITQKSLLVLGLSSLGALGLAVPSFAQPTQAYASGSSSIILMNGATQSVAAEIAAPVNNFFNGQTPTNGDVMVTPTYQGTTNNLSSNTVSLATLKADAGTATVYDQASFTQVAAAILTVASGGTSTLTTATKTNIGANLSDTVSVIKAGAGNNGLE